MANKLLAYRDVVLVNLPSHSPKGHEQEGVRPMIIVGIPQGELRFPVVIVVPLTTQIGIWKQSNPDLYPTITSGIGGLAQTSIVLVDQVRAIDVQRVSRYLGSLSGQEYQPILNALKQIFIAIDEV